MLAATVKIGAKHFVHVEVLQAIKSKMDHLPVKPKTMLDFRDAALFLYPCIKTALQKNYTKDEILQIIVKEGWELTQNSFRYLWSFFLSEDENCEKKKSAPKSHSKEKRVAPKLNAKNSINKAKENSDVILQSEDDKLNTQGDDFETLTADGTDIIHETAEFNSSAEEKLQPEKSDETHAQTQSAHFDLPPDTEDL